jgi:hypothetical protein
MNQVGNMQEGVEGDQCVGAVKEIIPLIVVDSFIDFIFSD